MTFDENKLIKNISKGMDWQEVLNEIVVEEGMDPWAIDIIKLTDSFVLYLQHLKKFDFRIPGRFILIAAILLRMKTEILFQEEEEKEGIKEEEMPSIDLEKLPKLTSPTERKSIRKVTLAELIDALNKAFKFKEKKESKLHRMKQAAETLIEEEEDIEERIEKIYKKIRSMGDLIKFSELVPDWKRKQIVEIFVPLLHLTGRGNVTMSQEEVFKEIFIRVKAKNT